MEYQTLYRKYRPNSFEMVYGQEPIVKTIKNMIKKNKLAHAYLFTGSRGTGKTTCAKLLAKAINCLNNIDGDVCNKCENCISYIKNSNPDIIEIDAASNNGVDEIRELKSKINLVPTISKYKVYIIDEVHMLSTGAFNALLKTLEEPPKYVIFILATTEPQKLPSTIISRCQRYDFKRINNTDMKKCLKNIIENENIKIEESALDEIIINSNGGLRDAIGFLDQASNFCEDIITKDQIEILSGTISDEATCEFIEEIFNYNYEYIFEKTELWDNLGKDFTFIIIKMLNYIENGILYKKGIIKKENNIDLYNKISDLDLYNFFDSLNEFYLKVTKSFQKKNTFQICIIHYIDLLKKQSNVSRETLQEKYINETSIINDKEILKKEINTLIDELKNIRINNIILNSSKNELLKVTSNWNKISEYLVNEKYKVVAGLLINSNPVASSSNGIIITFDEEIIVKRIEIMYDISKELINLITDGKYKPVFISTENWKKLRPEYLKKYKNNELKEQDEKNILLKIHEFDKKDEINEFAELIEME